MTISNGSGLWSKMKTQLNHLLTHGISGEVKDVRQDLAATLTPLAAFSVDEYTAPVASGNTVLQAATATVASPVTLAWGSGLTDGGNKANLLLAPRQVSFTSGGTTPAHVPATATITGTDITGKHTTEAVTLATTASTVNSKTCWATITSIVYTAAGGTDATVSVGFTKTLGLSHKVKSRGGNPMMLVDWTDGSASGTPGAMVSTTNAAPYGGYTPNTAPNGTHNFAVYYELDGTNLPDA